MNSNTRNEKRKVNAYIRINKDLKLSLYIQIPEHLMADYILEKGEQPEKIFTVYVEPVKEAA